MALAHWHCAQPFGIGIVAHAARMRLRAAFFFVCAGCSSTPTVGPYIRLDASSPWLRRRAYGARSSLASIRRRARRPTHCTPMQRALRFQSALASGAMIGATSCRTRRSTHPAGRLTVAHSKRTCAPTLRCKGTGFRASPHGSSSAAQRPPRAWCCPSSTSPETCATTRGSLRPTSAFCMCIRSRSASVCTCTRPGLPSAS
jgi:hypothetical protein